MRAILSFISGLLVVFGALNWGLIGAFDYDLITALCGTHTLLTQSLQIIIGLAGLHQVISAYFETYE